MKRYIPLLTAVVLVIAVLSVFVYSANAKNANNKIPDISRAVIYDYDSHQFTYDYSGGTTGNEGGYYSHNAWVDGEYEIVNVYLDRHITYGDIAITVSVLLLTFVIIVYAFFRLPKLWLR